MHELRIVKIKVNDAKVHFQRSIAFNQAIVHCTLSKYACFCKWQT